MDVLTVSRVAKRFPLQTDRPFTFKDSALQWMRGGLSRTRYHWALQDVSFVARQGVALGIIGHNGAGKSTLLRLLCGLGRPTHGQIERRGQVSGLLDLGGGFHHELTGRENIMTGGLLRGHTRREVLALEDEIIAFAELEQFIDQPIRTYSSGMYLRLAFASAMHFDPQVLIVDEILAVGDARFQKKCLDRLAEFRAAGKTLILTSHVMEQVRSLCDEVLVLSEGRIVMQGDPEEGISCYHDQMRQRSEARASQQGAARLSVAQGARQGTQEASIELVELFDQRGAPAQSIGSGEALTIALHYAKQADIRDMVMTLGVFDQNSVKCFETSIPSVAAHFGELPEHGIIRCQFETLPLMTGRYYVNIGLYPANWDFVYDYHWQMHDFFVAGDELASAHNSGVLALQPNWAVTAPTRG